jgi:hypothetical protein
MSAGAKTRMSAPIEVDSSNMKHSLPNKKADDFISFDNTEVAFSSAHSEINKPIALSKAATKAKSQVVTSAPTEQNPWNSSGAGKNAQATTEVLDTSATLQLNAPSTLVDLDADVMGEEQTKLIRQAFTTANEDEEDVRFRCVLLFSASFFSTRHLFFLSGNCQGKNGAGRRECSGGHPSASWLGSFLTCFASRSCISLICYFFLLASGLLGRFWN